MNVDWDINWAPTIVTVIISVGVAFLVPWLRKKWIKSKLPSEEIEVTYQEEGSTHRFRGVKTWSRREYELKANGGERFSEEIINFDSQEGSSTISADEIAKEMQDSWKQPKPKKNRDKV